MENICYTKLRPVGTGRHPERHAQSGKSVTDPLSDRTIHKIIGGVCIELDHVRASQVALVVKNPLANVGDVKR